MAFFTLGFMDSNKSVVIVNFILDIVLCTVSLSKVLKSDGFQRYLEWENKWIASQNALYQAELQQIHLTIIWTEAASCSALAHFGRNP